MKHRRKDCRADDVQIQVQTSTRPAPGHSGKYQVVATCDCCGQAEVSSWTPEALITAANDDSDTPVR